MKDASKHFDFNMTMNKSDSHVNEKKILRANLDDDARQRKGGEKEERETQTNRQTEKDKQKHRQTERQTDRQTNRQTGKTGN